MVDGVRYKGQPLTRDVIDLITKGNARAIRAFENLTHDVGEALPDAIDANAATVSAAQADADAAQISANAAQADATSALGQITAFSAIPFLTMSASALLTSERVLTAGTNITITDAGAGGSATVSLTATNITGVALDMIVAPKVPPATQDAGRLTMKAQDATDPAYTGGFVEIKSGSGANGGEMQIRSGNGVNIGGDFILEAGSGTDPGATGGSFLMTGGFALAAGGTGGSFLMQAGGGDAATGSIWLATPIGNAIEITDDLAAVKIGFFGATPALQPTTATGSAAFVVGAGTAVNTASTFDGYTLAKVVKALRNLGILT